MPHSPHTIRSRTISSVATNTNRVNPTLCHILGVGGRPAQSGRAVGAGGRASGRALVARPGLQRREPGAEERWGGMGDGRPSAAPPGGGAALGGHHGRPD